MNKQIIILETEEGSAHSEKQLKEVWEERLKQVAPYYKVKSVEIKKNANK